MTYKGGGSKGRQCVKVLSDDKIDNLYKSFRTKQQASLTKQDIENYRYESNNDKLFRSSSEH